MLCPSSVRARGGFWLMLGSSLLGVQSVGASRDASAGSARSRPCRRHSPRGTPSRPLDRAAVTWRTDHGRTVRRAFDDSSFFFLVRRPAARAHALLLELSLIGELGSRAWFGSHGGYLRRAGPARRRTLANRAVGHGLLRCHDRLHHDRLQGACPTTLMRERLIRIFAESARPACLGAG